VLAQDSILVAGYPMGGDSLSITKGIVSRVVMTRYAHASNKLLGIQIDAAINPGNSGGPAFLDLQQVALSGPPWHSTAWTVSMVLSMQQEGIKGIVHLLAETLIA